MRPAIFSRWHSEKKPPRQRVVLDTNVISRGIGDRKKTELEVIKITQRDNNDIYLGIVDKELGNIKVRKSPKKKLFVECYRLKHRWRRTAINNISDDVWKEIPARGADKQVLYDSLREGAKIIVTNDKRFRSLVNKTTKKGWIGKIRLSSPEEYLDSKRDSKTKETNK